MHPSLTLEKRITAEIAGYDGQMSVYIDDLKGNVIAIGADEKFETASIIKTFILACLFEQVERKKANLDETIDYRPQHFILSLIHI